MSTAAWASDVPVSLPLPPEDDTLVKLEAGFIFTKSGLFHDITQTTYEALTPTFGPLDDPRSMTIERNGSGGD